MNALFFQNATTATTTEKKVACNAKQLNSVEEWSCLKSSGS